MKQYIYPANTNYIFFCTFLLIVVNRLGLLYASEYDWLVPKLKLHVSGGFV